MKDWWNHLKTLRHYFLALFLFFQWTTAIHAQTRRWRISSVTHPTQLLTIPSLEKYSSPRESLRCTPLTPHSSPSGERNKQAQYCCGLQNAKVMSGLFVFDRCACFYRAFFFLGKQRANNLSGNKKSKAEIHNVQTYWKMKLGSSVWHVRRRTFDRKDCDTNLFPAVVLFPQTKTFAPHCLWDVPFFIPTPAKDGQFLLSRQNWKPYGGC